METFPILKTNRLSLEHIRQNHAHTLFEILSSKDVLQFYGMDPLTDEKQASSIIDSFHTIYNKQRGIRWAIIWKETKEFIGTIGLNHLFLPGKRAEIGFEIHPSFWNKGIVTEAAGEVMRYAFTELDIHRMGAVTFPANIASIHVLKKLGFEREDLLRGYICQEGKNHDANVFSILQPDWKKRQKKLEYEVDERLQYTDHLTEIIRHAESKGDFDNLPGKGKPLHLGQSYFTNPYEKQLNKTLKDNHVLPYWIKLGKEIDKEKELLETLLGKEHNKKVRQINKRIKTYNEVCPPSLQRNKLSDQ